VHQPITEQTRSFLFLLADFILLRFVFLVSCFVLVVVVYVCLCIIVVDEEIPQLLWKKNDLREG